MPFLKQPHINQTEFHFQIFQIRIDNLKRIGTDINFKRYQTIRPFTLKNSVHLLRSNFFINNYTYSSRNKKLTQNSNSKNSRNGKWIHVRFVESIQKKKKNWHCAYAMNFLPPYPRDYNTIP